MNDTQLSLVENIERDKYTRVWKNSRYRKAAWGLKLWREQRDIFPETIKTALDVGTGHGRLMAQWLFEGIDARGVDIVNTLDRPDLKRRLLVTPIWKMVWPKPFDLAVAADVLEHLPTDLVDDSLRAIAKSTSVLIAQNAEYDSVGWGYKLHLTIQPASWWIGRMQAIGGVAEELPLKSKPGSPKHLIRWVPELQ